MNDATLKRLEQSRAPSTKAIYNSKWALFCGYCQERGLQPLKSGRAVVANFLEWAFASRKLTAGTLQGYRSAIGAQLKFSSDYDPGKDEVISQLIMAFSRVRPVQHKSILRWDIALVLKYLKYGKLRRTKHLDARSLTLKAVFLTLLASGKRRGEVHALRNELGNVRGDWSAVTLKPYPGFISKTQLRVGGVGKFAELVIPAISSAPGYTEADLALCPVQTLRVYADKADSYRSENQRRLFISWFPSRLTDIQPSALSHYVRELVKQAYEDEAESPSTCREFDMSAHDLRGIATSLKALTSLSMRDLLQAGSWASPNTFLKHYVKDFSQNAITGLHELGPFVTAGSIFA